MVSSVIFTTDLMQQGATSKLLKKRIPTVSQFEPVG